MELTRGSCSRVAKEDHLELFKVLLRQGRYGRVLRPGLSIPGAACARYASAQSVVLDPSSARLSQVVCNTDVAVALVLRNHYLYFPLELFRKTVLLARLPWV